MTSVHSVNRLMRPPVAEIDVGIDSEYQESETRHVSMLGHSTRLSMHARSRLERMLDRRAFY
jgi:hypothetical protein